MFDTAAARHKYIDVWEARVVNGKQTQKKHKVATHHPTLHASGLHR